MVLENHCFLQQQEMPHTSAVLQDACDVYVNGSWNHWQMCGDRMCMCKVAALYEDCGDFSSPSHDETLCHKLHIGRLWYLDAQQDACAMCALWTAAEGTLDTGRGSPDACHCESSAGILS